MPNLNIRLLTDETIEGLDKLAAQTGAKREAYVRDLLVNHVRSALSAPRVDRQIAARLRRLISDMQHARHNSIGDCALPLNELEFAELAGFKKPADIERYLSAETEPTFEALDKIAQSYNVNPRWLKYGEGAPYQTEHLFKDPTDVLDLLFDAKELGPRPQVYFIRAIDRTGTATIAFREANGYRYHIAPAYFHLSNAVGGVGTAQIADFVKLAAILWDMMNSHLVFDLIEGQRGLEIPGETLMDLLNGNVHPAEILDNRRFTNSLWFEDLLDLYEHQNDIAQGYDQNFRDAQQRAREYWATRYVLLDGKRATVTTDEAYKALRRKWLEDWTTPMRRARAAEIRKKGDAIIEQRKARRGY